MIILSVIARREHRSCFNGIGVSNEAIPFPGKREIASSSLKQPLLTLGLPGIPRNDSSYNYIVNPHNMKENLNC